MDPFALATSFERWVSLAIALAAVALATLSFAAWRRERAPRMRIVGLGYGAFALFGLLVFGERLLVRLAGAPTAEILEHGASILVLVGLLLFFVAIRQE